MKRRVVLDASALVDLLASEPTAAWVEHQMTGRTMVAPAHFASEVLSAFGRRHRAGESSTEEVDVALADLVALSIQAEGLSALITGAWERRRQLRLADALYVELAAQLDTVVITTDRRLARATSLAVAPPDDEGT